jgi:hypothetical protein
MNSLDQFFCLAPLERAVHYREAADVMRSRAEIATMKETQDGYFFIAAQWLRMAERLEAEYGKVIVQSDLAFLLQHVPS